MRIHGYVVKALDYIPPVVSSLGLSPCLCVGLSSERELNVL